MAKSYLSSTKAKDGGASGRQGPSYADNRDYKAIRNKQTGRDAPMSVPGQSIVNPKGTNANYQRFADTANLGQQGLDKGSTPPMYTPYGSLSLPGKPPSTPGVKASQQPRFTSPGGGFVAKGGVPGEKHGGKSNPFQGRDTMGSVSGSKGTGMKGPAKLWGSGGDKAHGQAKNKLWGNARKNGGP